MARGVPRQALHPELPRPARATSSGSNARAAATSAGTSPTSLFAADPWFRGIDLGYGPDGGVFVLDWSDTGECHEHNGVHRTSGRIYKVTYGQPARTSQPSTWPGSTTRAWWRCTGTRTSGSSARPGACWPTGRPRGEPARRGRQACRSARSTGSPTRSLKLRALWTLHVDRRGRRRLAPPPARTTHESVRAWAIRLLTDDLPLDTIFSQRVDAGRRAVRPTCWRRSTAWRATTLGPGPAGAGLDAPAAAGGPPARAGRALARARRGRRRPQPPAPDLDGLIPVADADPVGARRARRATAGCPDVARSISRRLAEDIDAQPAPLNALLGVATRGRPERSRRSVLAAWPTPCAGRRKARKPEAWDAFRRPARVESDAAASRPGPRTSTSLFGDGRALDEVKRLALDDKADLEARKAALRTLIESRPPDLRAICERLLRVRFLNASAVRGLALFDDPAIGRSLAANYRAFHPSERSGRLLETLVSRPAFARALLDQVAAGKIPASDLTAFHARQIRSLGDPALDRAARRGLGRAARPARRPASADRGAQGAAHADRPGRGRPRPGPRRLRPGLRLVPHSSTATAATSAPT